MNFAKNHSIQMLKGHILSFICLLMPFIALSQHSDCKDALVYDSKKEGNISVPKGFGNEQEIVGHDIYNDYFFTQEHNTLWIYLYFRDSTEFEFELTPKRGNDDFDFMLYKIDRPNFCNYIKENQPLPIRSNLARKHQKTGSITGMKKGHENPFAKAGYEPYFSSTLKVKRGEEFYLIIDSPYGSDAYFNLFSETVFIDTSVLPKEIAHNSIIPEIKEEKILQTKIKVAFANQNDNHVEFKGIKLNGIENEDSLIFFKRDSLVFISNTIPKKYSFNVTASGFEPQDFTYYSTILKDTNLIFKLKELKVGAVLKFKNIKFASNKPTILEDSFSELAKLYSFLIANENIKIEIGGHVNGLGRNRHTYKSLSKKRAKSVYKELIELGVLKSRMEFKGYGNKNPVYINPTSSIQSSENRRVEITITSLN